MQFFRDWLTGQWVWPIILVVVVGLAAVLRAPMLQHLEWQMYDRGLQLAHRSGVEVSLALVEIDARSLGGQAEDLPTQLARLIHLLNADGARGIGIVLPLESDPGLPTWFTALGQVVGESQLVVADRASVNRMQRLLSEGERDLDRTGLLVRVMASGGMTYLPFRFGNQLGSLSSPADLPDFLWRHTIAPRAGTTVAATAGADWVINPADRAVFPAPRLAGAAVGVGYLDAPPDRDGIVRGLPLVVGHHGRYHAALALLLANSWLEGSPAALSVEPGRGIYMGTRFIATDTEMRVYPGRMGDAMTNWWRVRLADLPPTPNGLFRGRMVLVGLAPELDVQRRMATDGPRTELEWQAGLTQRLASLDFYTRPPWAEQGRWVALAGAALMVLMLPLFPGWLAMGLAWGLGAGLVATLSYLLVFQRLWVALGTPALLLILGGGVVGMHHGIAHLRDLAYLADDGDVRPWWAEPGRRLRRQGRQWWDRLRGNPATPARLIEAAGAAGIPDLPAAQAQPQPILARLRAKRAEGETREMTGVSPSPHPTVKSDPGTQTSKSVTGGSNGSAIRTLGRYTIENQLGKGAMGAVYRGVDPRINRVVAIKTLNLQQEFEAEELEQVKERFFHEAEVAGRLNHPHIVTIYDVGEDRGLGYIAMELVDGHDMRRYTRKEGLLPINRIMEMAAQIAEALDYAHRNGVVHRDIKPSNIMLDKAGRQVKVADFGIARIGSSGKTRTGTVLGTPPYMSPEQLSGRPLDGRSDLFSLGVVLFELVSGRRPFEGDTVAILMTRIANDPHPDLMVLRGGVPACLRNIIDKALEKDVNKRYPNAGAMRLALLRCIENNYTGTGFGGRGT
jgi:serine/threonine-protein kinase